MDYKSTIYFLNLQLKFKFTCCTASSLCQFLLLLWAGKFLSVLHTRSSCRTMFHKSSYQFLSMSSAHAPGIVPITVPLVRSLILSPMWRLSEGKEFAQSAGIWTQDSLTPKPTFYLTLFPTSCSEFVQVIFFHLNSRLLSLIWVSTQLFPISESPQAEFLAHLFRFVPSYPLPPSKSTTVQRLPSRELFPGWHHQGPGRVQTFQQLLGSLPLKSPHLFPFCLKATLTKFVMSHVGLRYVR